MTPILDPAALGGVAFALGIAAGVFGPTLWRWRRSRGDAAAGSAAATPVPRLAEEREPPTIRRLNANEFVEPTEPTDFTKLATPGQLLRDGLPNLHDNEETAEETPSVSLVSYIDQLDPREPKPEPLRVLAAGRRDIGKQRQRNEDRYVVVSDDNAKQHLFAVVDGIGGRGGGGVASRLAAEVVAGKFGAPDVSGSRSDKRPSNANALVWAIEHANRAIWETAQETPQLEGMGSTIAAAVCDAEKRCVYIAYVGDSRAYRLRRGRCELLTVDHTLAPEGPMATYLRRALGVRARVKVDVVVGSAEPGDAYLLCTDGLSKMKSDQEIANVLAANEDPDDAASALVAEANRAGGKDNIAVVVFRLQDRRPAKRVAAPPAPVGRQAR